MFVSTFWDAGATDDLSESDEEGDADSDTDLCIREPTHVGSMHIKIISKSTLYHTFSCFCFSYIPLGLPSDQTIKRQIMSSGWHS